MRRAYLLTLLTVACWTTGPIGNKAALTAERAGAHLTPLQVAFWAIALGAVLSLVLLTLRGRLRRLAAISARGWVILVLMGLSGWAGYPVLTNIAYQRLSMPDAVVLTCLSPVFVVLFQGAPFGRVVRPISGWEQVPEGGRHPPVGRLAIGMLACLLGVAVIASDGRLSALGAGLGSVSGAAAAVAAVLVWAVYSNLARFVTVRPGADASDQADVQNFGAMTVGIVALAIGLAGSGQLWLPRGFETTFYLSTLGPVRVEVWVPIAAMAALNFCVGYNLWLSALEAGDQVGRAHALPPLTYLIVVSSTGVGWLVLRESWGPGFWQGTALVAAGNLVALWPTRYPLRRMEIGEAASPVD